MLFREWHPALLRFLRAQAPKAAEDLADEVWMTAADKIAHFEGGLREWRVWLFTLAHSRLIDHRCHTERRRTHPKSQEVFAKWLPAENPAQKASDRLSAQAAINRLVAELTAEQAEVILLRVVAGLDAAQVGRIVGRNARWVRVTQHRAIRRLSEDPFDAAGRDPARDLTESVVGGNYERSSLSPIALDEPARGPSRGCGLRGRFRAGR